MIGRRHWNKEIAKPISITNKQEFSGEKRRGRWRKGKEPPGINPRCGGQQSAGSRVLNVTSSQKMFKGKDVLCLILSCLPCAKSNCLRWGLVSTVFPGKSRERVCVIIREPERRVNGAALRKAGESDWQGEIRGRASEESWQYLGGASFPFGEGNGSPLQCSCPENPRDGGAWWAAVYGVAQSRTRLKRLKWLSNSSSFPLIIGRGECQPFILCNSQRTRWPQLISGWEPN